MVTTSHALPDEPARQRCNNERRQDERHKLILRVGVIEQAGRSLFCLVRNISSTGVQLRIYARPQADAEAALRVSDEPSIAGRIVWIDGDMAGMAFAEELDSSTLLRVRQKLTPNRRRGTPRVAVRATATIRTGGQTRRAVVSDISCSGLRVSTERPLEAGNRAVVALADLPSLNAFVRWTDGDVSGLTFETPIPMPIIADWVDRRAPCDALELR